MEIIQAIATLQDAVQHVLNLIAYVPTIFIAMFGLVLTWYASVNWN